MNVILVKLRPNGRVDRRLPSRVAIGTFRAPACFSRRQWKAWRTEALKNVPRSQGTSRFRWCVDCTQARQLDMLIAGGCRHPEVRFRFDREGMLEGYVPGSDEEIKEPKEKKPREMPLPPETAAAKLLRSHWSRITQIASVK